MSGECYRCGAKGVSWAYKIALENPSIGTVAALHETWIKFAEEIIRAAESRKTKEAEIRAKVLAQIKELRETQKDAEEDGERDAHVYGWKADGMEFALALLTPATTSEEEQA